MTKTTAEDAAQLARDLDRAPSGQQVVERLISGIVVLKREHAELKAQHVELRTENAELKAKLDQVLDKLLALTNLVHGHEMAIQLLQAGSGGIVQ